MDLKIAELGKKDHKLAIQAAIKGMHFDWYFDHKIPLNLYGRYFWYLELTRATQVIAAYAGNEFAGVLLAEIKGEEKKYRSIWKSIYVKLFDILQHIVAGNSAGAYNHANQEMFRRYCKEHSPDGEIIFLAANPNVNIKGIGSLLVGELERREPGKTIYLYTDNACTYQFYEHRGFDCVGEQDIILELGDKKIDLKCLLYSKTIYG